MAIYKCEKCGKISARKSFNKTHACALKEPNKALRALNRGDEAIYQVRYEKFLGCVV